MRGAGLVGALQAGLVTARQHHAALELVADDRGGHSAKEGERPLVAGDPVGHLLGPGRFGVGVVRGAEDGHEQLDLDHLARRRVDEVRPLAGVVDEQLVAGPVDLSHGQPLALQPAAVDVAEPGIAIPVRVLLEVLEVQQFERHAGLGALGVDRGAVGPRPLALPHDVGAPIEPALERLVVGQGLHGGPVEPGDLGPSHDARHRTQTDPEAVGHGPVAEPQGPLLAEDLADLAHG